jgi:mitochondrial enoyl-[acyl-carrier protein] reductase / trans-2-enoyl-CoA reductase
MHPDPFHSNPQATMSPSAVLRQFGSVAVEDWPVAPPGRGEVTVAMLAAPVNPADLNIIEGQYGELPVLPAVVGNEGAGRVASVGEGVAGFAPGDLVAVLRRGTWARHITLPADDLFKLPGDLDPWQASMMGVNPPTALLMLRGFADLQPGEWVAQNAANSAVGRAVIQIARARGLRTLNVVRREELFAELADLGADRVVTEETDLRKETKALCDGARPRLGLNAVGGQSALNIASTLAPGSTLVTYGGMARQPLKIPNSLLIFKDLRFAGFWLTRWKSRAPADEKSAVFSDLAALSRAGNLRIAIHAKFPLGDLSAALDAAAAPSRKGKILLDLGA